MVIVPPYCGVPRLSHQFPVAEVVTAVVGDNAVVLVAILVLVLVAVLTVLIVVVVVDVDVDVVVDELQDASSIAAIIKKLKTNQINLFFNFILHFN